MTIKNKIENKIEDKIEDKSTMSAAEIPALLPELISIKSHKDEHLDYDFKASGNRLLELKGNRHVDDIPLSDEYWAALKYHNRAVDLGYFSK